jgi:hypothetical protein
VPFNEIIQCGNKLAVNFIKLEIDENESIYKQKLDIKLSLSGKSIDLSKIEMQAALTPP